MATKPVAMNGKNTTEPFTVKRCGRALGKMLHTSDAKHKISQNFCNKCQ